MVTMLAGGHRADRTLTGAPQRIVFSTTPDATTFGLEFPAGADVEVAGMQVEAQAGASAYRATTGGGIYEGARLADDALEIATTGMNRHACMVRILYANHL
jgi:hypothetical protein